MKKGDIYYNPKTNKIAEYVRTIDFTVMGVTMLIYDVYTDSHEVEINGATYTFHSGPILGIMEQDFKGFYKIGSV
jgi:hypothetical protein